MAKWVLPVLVGPRTARILDCSAIGLLRSAQRVSMPACPSSRSIAFRPRHDGDAFQARAGTPPAPGRASRPGRGARPARRARRNAAAGASARAPGRPRLPEHPAWQKRWRGGASPRRSRRMIGQRGQMLDRASGVAGLERLAPALEQKVHRRRAGFRPFQPDLLGQPPRPSNPARPRAARRAAGRAGPRPPPPGRNRHLSPEAPRRYN